MEIRLKPEHEAIVAEDIASGRHASPEEYVAEAVDLLHERQYFGETMEQQRESLEAAWQEGERGELMSLDDFRKEMEEFKTAWKARHQRV
jgi:Arc/MetJ-type ribon-helix-helix transcriptional regulator